MSWILKGSLKIDLKPLKNSTYLLLVVVEKSTDPSLPGLLFGQSTNAHCN